MVLACAIVLLVDGVLFRDWLPGDYIDHYTAPLWPRTLTACLGSMREEVEGRLVIMTAVTAALHATGRVRPALSLALGALAGQLALVGGLVIAFPAYASLRFLAVGLVWAWTYWRHGWITALAAHGTSHLLLDPLLLAVLR